MRSVCEELTDCQAGLGLVSAVWPTVAARVFSSWAVSYVIFYSL